MAPCSECGAALNEDSRFCPSCGASTEEASYVFCAACGERNADSSKYCDKCGTLLVRPSGEATEQSPPEETEAQPAPPEPVSEEPQPVSAAPPEQPTASATSWDWLHYVGFGIAGYVATVFVVLLLLVNFPIPYAGGMAGLASIAGAVLAVGLTRRFDQKT